MSNAISKSPGRGWVYTWDEDEELDDDEELEDRAIKISVFEGEGE